MEHGLAKILDFPHQPNHAPYAPFTLNPGLQGLLKLVGGLLLVLGLFTRTVAFCPRGRYGGGLFHRARAERCLPAAQREELAIVHSFVFLYFWVAGGGEWSLDRICKPASTSAVPPSPA